MVKIKKKSARQSAKPTAVEMDGIYIFKLVMLAILGSLWLKVGSHGTEAALPLPIGLIIGLFVSSRERFKMDRKIEYAVLVVAALFGFIAPYGLFISF